MSGLNRLSATAAARKLAAREITAEALLADCLERIAEREPDVHAWTFLDTDAALRRARALDAQGTSGLLHGLPIAVKDLFDTFDMPCSYGSPIYANHRPAWDAACVAVARAAGALARGVPDVALLGAALADRHELLIDRSTTDVPRIGLCRTYEWNRAQPETIAVLEDAGKRLRAAGASVRDVTLPPPFAGLAEAQTTIMVCEVAKSLAYENLTHREQLSADMTKMIDAGLAVSPQQ